VFLPAENPSSSFSAESRPVSEVAWSSAYPGHAIRSAYLSAGPPQHRLALTYVHACCVAACVHACARARLWKLLSGESPFRSATDNNAYIRAMPPRNRILRPQLLTNSAPGPLATLSGRVLAPLYIDFLRMRYMHHTRARARTIGLARLLHLEKVFRCGKRKPPRRRRYPFDGETIAVTCPFPPPLPDADDSVEFGTRNASSELVITPASHLSLVGSLLTIGMSNIRCLPAAHLVGLIHDSLSGLTRGSGSMKPLTKQPGMNSQKCTFPMLMTTDPGCDY
jgi:hypothetical protein